MKNGTLYILLIVLCLPFCYGDQGINIYEFNKPIIITDNVENTTGHPCTSCECNLTIYNVNSNIVNYSIIMTHLGNGIFENEVPKYAINENNTIYPVKIECNHSNYWGVSDIKGFRVIDDMFDYSSLVFIMIASTFLFGYIGFNLQGTDKNKVILKWTFLSLSLLFLVATMILGNIIAGLTSSLGLPDYFFRMIIVVGFILVAVAVYAIYHIAFEGRGNSED